MFSTEDKWETLRAVGSSDLEGYEPFAKMASKVCIKLGIVMPNGVKSSPECSNLLSQVDLLWHAPCNLPSFIYIVVTLPVS